MNLRSRCLKAVALACLALAWTLSSAVQAPGTPEKMRISQSAPLDPDDPLHKWFMEQDRLLDDILVRLSRIEKIVDDLHRLIMKWPGPPSTPAAHATSAAAPTPPPAATPPPVTTPTAAPLPTPSVPTPTSASAPVERDDNLSSLALPLLAGLAVVLSALWLWRRPRGQSSAPPDAIPSPDVPKQPVAKAAPPPVSETKSSPSKQGTSISIVHNDQALELAEIMLSMGLGHGAAQTLVEQIRREPKQALLHWLKLLEIYRKNGQQAEFERSAEELRQYFNVQPEDWNADPGTVRSLEDYPHIAAQLTELWGSPTCLVYMQNLLDDNRGGARCGFPQSVAEELVLLSAVLKSSLTGA